MALKETYVSEVRKVPKANRVFVMRKRGNDELAPSEKLFRDFKAQEAAFRREGRESIEAHNLAWRAVDFEKRFRKDLLSNPRAVEKLRRIAEHAREKDLYLICYEKPPKNCHRFLLMGLADKLMEKGPRA